MSKYETDFYAWTNEQASLLRAGKLSEIDIENIAEEIESMGKSERRELVSRLNILFLHLLKWTYQPERRGNSWRASILNNQIQLEKHIRENPSLKSYIDEVTRDSYELARLDASGETDLDVEVFPVVCPWSYDEAMSFKPEI